MSTNTPSPDQPDKASDFDDELGVPAYKPSSDSASGATSSASPVSGAKPVGEPSSPSDQPTTSFKRPTDADIKASEQRNSSAKKPSGVRIVESVDPVAPASPKTSGAPADANPSTTTNSAESKSAKPSKPSKSDSVEKAPASPSATSSASAGAAAGGAVGASSAAADAGAVSAAAAKPEATKEVPRSSVFDRPGRAQPQEITPNTTQAPQSTVESQSRETMNMGPTTGSNNSPYDDRDFARSDSSYEQASGSVNSAADYGNEPTTVQPAASPAGGAAAGAGAAGMAATQHFDSPSQYSDETALALDADTAAAAQEEEEKALRRQYGKRGTIDFGLLFIRIALGGYLIIEGVRTLFSIGASTGISGLESEYGSYAMADILAMGIPVGQLVAGVFLVLGLLTPFASMLALVVTGFMAIHELAGAGTGLDVFAWPESLWLGLVLFVVNVGVQFTGPGFISVDSALGVKALSSPARRPLASSWVFFILGAAALVAVWWFGAGINPLN